MREQVNQSLGSFEQSDILRGYVFDGKEYQDVLNTPQKIESSWNNLWNKGELQEPSLWRRVTEETESKWTGGDEPSLTIIENLASSPYLLADLPDFKDYRIVRKDGTTAYVDAEELKF